MPDTAVDRPPKISVCIPTYNRAPLLRGFLESILSQTAADFEVIISDNGSTDATPEIVKEYPDPRLRYYRNDMNIGPYRNMNRLLDLARGEYVCIVHDDDVYSPEFLERESEMLDRHPNVGMVHCAVHEVDADGTRRRTVRSYPGTRILPGQREFTRYLQGHNVCCSSVMARRSLFRDAGPFDSRFLSADFLMWIKFALRADVAYIADPLVQMRVHQEAVTSWLNPSRWHDEFIAILDEGFALGVKAYPALAADRSKVYRLAARAQGRRFLVAALSAVARGEFELARGYTAVLDKLRAIGLSPASAVMARCLTNRPGKRVLAVVARLRRARARRMMMSLARPAARV